MFFSVRDAGEASGGSSSNMISMQSTGLLEVKDERFSSADVDDVNPSSAICRRDTSAVPLKRNDTLLAGGRQHGDANDAAVSTSLTSSRTKKSLLFLLATLSIVVPYCRQILHNFGTDLLLKTNIHQRRPDVLSVDVDARRRPLLPNRIANLDPSDKFSFVHISKCAGATWIRLFLTVLHLGICPEKEAGVNSPSHISNNTHAKMQIIHSFHYVHHDIMCGVNLQCVNILIGGRELPETVPIFHEVETSMKMMKLTLTHGLVTLILLVWATTTTKTKQIITTIVTIQPISKQEHWHRHLKMCTMVEEGSIPT